jgi:hypothetical protein
MACHLISFPRLLQLHRNMASKHRISWLASGSTVYKYGPSSIKFSPTPRIVILHPSVLYTRINKNKIRTQLSCVHQFARSIKSALKTYSLVLSKEDVLSQSYTHIMMVQAHVWKITDIALVVLLLHLVQSVSGFTCNTAPNTTGLCAIKKGTNPDTFNRKPFVFRRKSLVTISLHQM